MLYKLRELPCNNQRLDFTIESNILIQVNVVKWISSASRPQLAGQHSYLLYIYREEGWCRPRDALVERSCNAIDKEFRILFLFHIFFKQYVCDI